MPELQRLRPDHAPALLTFEQENRTYFAASVPDRGDAYFTDFAAQLTARLTEQAAGICHFHLLVDPDGEVLGRFNLVDIADGSADLGFRVAEKATRRGLATATVLHLCTLAATEYGLTTLRAAAALDNTASRTVLTRAGFVPTGEEVRLSGRPGLGYVRDLSRDPEDGAR
ncbi:GNAT family N-acetyltransferase [Streptomyces sp. NBC_00264]|uniref:GNAT family N-acetyltransferase n=1 Tax=unclassified Streptomyces TaxID=2593676 RepID=UPI00225431EE|nr:MULTISPECIES: GNAT family N-acetyltransferase [unclassified Streptomyces]MCX4396418.1 GNAT family N-acetyltransferase [Streptomyces sp. NBC_01767]MCX5160462.1 GNAT family N-acetyltransferase [Streptomyces sp. NBC_00305]MCX5218985.1 GNAT family N-acetyltransferase [Streptomyces sp. NBC_00264]WSG51033.1 GNAT family N-acetyltransferase [Streptomyces sp. NBC_01732]